MNNFSKRKVNGSDVISEFGDKIFDSNGKRILNDVEYIITVIKINGEKKVIIRDVDSDHDSVVLMRLMLYVQSGFDNIIKMCNEINLPFEDIKNIIEEMVLKLIEDEQYELASKLNGELKNYKEITN